MTEKSNMPLWQKMLLGITLGILVGYILSPHGMALFDEATTKTIAEWIALPGALFMALIKMIVIPLVVCSITLAVVGSGSMEELRGTGGRVGIYFVMTTTVSVLIGIMLAKLIEPGLYIDRDLITDLPATGALPVIEGSHSLPSMLIGLFPTNPAKAVVDSSMLQIVIGSILLGIALLTMTKKHNKPLIDLCTSGQEVCMKVVDWAMAIAPIAVFGFLCTLTIKLGPDTLIAMSVYMGTVLLGLVLLLIMYLTLVTVVAKRNPLTFLKDIRNAQVLAFSTSSSAATMPLSIKTAEENLNIRSKIVRLVIPLGTTINMDGTALYQIIAALFLVQIFGIDLSTMQLAVLSVTIIGASIGSPGSPGVGLVILATILSQIGVNAGGIALILGVDRLLDMCRTTLNVTGDLTAAAVMDRWVKS